jgi:hypothetical protein
MSYCREMSLGVTLGRIVSECLDATFRGGSLACPSTPPHPHPYTDTPADPRTSNFYTSFCGFFKDKIHATKVTGAEDVKTRIVDVVIINSGMPAPQGRK